jgi:hypothetical protein
MHRDGERPVGRGAFDRHFSAIGELDRVASGDGVSEKKSPAEYARGKLRSPLTVAKEGKCRSLPGRVS